MKIPTFLELRKKKEVVENQNEKNLLKEFNKLIKAKLPVCGEVSIPCDSKFLSIAKTIQETFKQKGWSVKFNITTSMCEIGSCRVIVKGVN